MIDLFLDLDDTLVNFWKAYSSLYGEEACSNEELFMVYWYKFIDERRFETLEWTHNGKELYTELEKLRDHINIRFLTSTGRREIPVKYSQDIVDQKKVWLKSNNLEHVPVIYVHTTEHETDVQAKAKRAHQWAVLIDDSERNCKAFIGQGGKAIRYTKESTVQDIIEQVKQEIGRYYLHYGSKYEHISI